MQPMLKSEYNRAFGKFLKQKRLSLNWTQTDLASRVGNNSQNVSRIERGELTPTIFWFEKLANAMETSASQLLKEFESHRKSI